MMPNMGEKRGICFTIWMFINHSPRDVNLALRSVIIWARISYHRLGKLDGRRPAIDRVRFSLAQCTLR